MDASVYGPALPPGFKQKEANETDGTLKVSVSKTVHIVGPQLPPEFVSKNDLESEGSDSESKVIGPVLPPGFISSQTAADDSDSDSDSVYGPMPAANISESVDGVIASIEKRATDMKKKLQGIDKPVDNTAKREEWMTLPATDYKNQFGIISRCLVDDSQPKTSNKRKASKISIEESRHSAKDEQLKEELEKYNKAKRAESLLELHKKSKKHKKDKESKEPKERKAFDRDAELGVRLMDRRQVNSVIRNASKLNSRFASGASQYL